MEKCTALVQGYGTQYERVNCLPHTGTPAYLIALIGLALLAMAYVCWRLARE